MIADEKRLFLGNLPPNITEDEIIKKFRKYGNVKLVEIKQRPDTSTFAFMNIQLDQDTLSSCFDSIRKKKWNGHSVKLEIAKESFLSRLEQERQSDKQNSHQNEERKIAVKRSKEQCEGETKMKNTSENNCYNTDFKSNHSVSFADVDDDNDSDDNDDSDDDEEEETPKWKLKKFEGIGHVTCENDTSSSSKGNVPAMLERLESFSSTWTDSQITTGLNKTNMRDRDKSTHKESKVKKDSRSKNSMLNETSKSKSLISEEKRKKALNEKVKLVEKQKEAIKMALSSMDSTQQNKKVIFSDNYDDESMGNNRSQDLFNNTSGEMQQEEPKRAVLFGDSSDDDDDDGDNETIFKIKSQFEGSGGKKLLELQSRYGNDKRFTLDEKFYESDNEDDLNEVTQKVDTSIVDDERSQQLAILQNVLGHEIPFTDRRTKSKSVQMLRFDPTKSEHTKFLKEATTKKKRVSIPELEFDPVSGAKLRIKDKKEAKNTENVKIPVSKEKFYKVEDSLRESLKMKKEQSTFSIRGLFGRNEEDLEEEEEEHNDIYSDMTLKKQKQIGWSSNPFKYDSSEDDDEAEVPEDVNIKVTDTQQNSIHFGENFFFVSDDPRFQEGLDFLSKNQMKEDQDFPKYRRELKQFIRVKVKNNMRSYNKFKKKIGVNKRKLMRRKQ